MCTVRFNLSNPTNINTPRKPKPKTNPPYSQLNLISQLSSSIHRKSSTSKSPAMKSARRVHYQLLNTLSAFNPKQRNAVKNCIWLALVLIAWRSILAKRVENLAHGKVGVKASEAQMSPTNVKLHSWGTFNEDVLSSDTDSEITVIGLLEQLNITRDTSDYLWYKTSVNISPSESFLHHGQNPTLSVKSAGHALHVFCNGQRSAFGTRTDLRFTYNGNVNLQAGIKIISLLSVAVGLPNNGPHFESWNTGVLGPVVLNEIDLGKMDLTWEKWSYQTGLKGQAMNLVSPSGISSVDWLTGSLAELKPQPLTWYKVLLGSELIKTSSEERSLLKNLGSWLGKITIGRNRI